MRCPRFTLRTTLIAFTLLAVAQGFYGRHLGHQRRQEWLVDEARRLCEAAGALHREHKKAEWHLFGLDGGRLTPEATHAIIEADRINLIVMYRPNSLATEAAGELSHHFQKVPHGILVRKTHLTEYLKQEEAGQSKRPQPKPQP